MKDWNPFENLLNQHLHISESSKSFRPRGVERVPRPEEFIALEQGKPSFQPVG
jgi:hypothetical protein